MFVAFYWGALIIVASLVVMFGLTLKIYPKKSASRHIGCISIICVFVIIVIVFINPASISATIFVGSEYPEGSDVGGIKWHQNYGSLFVLISSGENVDLDNFDAYIETDAQAILPTIVYSSASTCSISLVEAAATAGEVIIVNTDTKMHLHVPFTKVVSSQLVHVHCDRLLKGSNMQILLPLVVAPHDPSRPTLKWAELSMSMEARYRPIDEPQIFKCYSVRREECEFPFTPNDYRKSFIYAVLTNLGFEQPTDPRCPANVCQLRTFVGGSSGVPGRPSDQSLVV